MGYESGTYCREQLPSIFSGKHIGNILSGNTFILCYCIAVSDLICKWDHNFPHSVITTEFFSLSLVHVVLNRK